MLEDSLREMFAARVQTPPPLAGDPATAAIARGRAVRRRRSVGSGFAVAAALLVTVGGVVSLGTVAAPSRGGNAAPAVGFDTDTVLTSASPTLPPSPTGDTGIGLDLWAGDRLWTVDGQELTLSGVGPVSRVYRVTEGWVYGGDSGVRFLRTDGTSLALVDGDGGWTVNGSGERMAFVLDTVLYVAHISARGLAVQTHVEVPPGLTPVTFHDQQVVVATPAGFDLLDPAARQFHPTWNPGLAAVYGTRGGTVLGLARRVGKEESCLADLRTDGSGLAADATGLCGVSLGGDGPGRVDGVNDAVPNRLAPGGSWLAEPRDADLRLVEVAPALDGRRADAVCLVDSSVEPAWADDRTLLAADGRGVVRCHTDGSQEVVPVPEGVPAHWRFVPRLAAGTVTR